MNSILTEESYALLQKIFVQLMCGKKHAALALVDQLEAAVKAIHEDA